MRETYELLKEEMKRAGQGMLPAGLIITGGGAQLAGAAELGREVLEMQVRVSGPTGMGGLTDTISDPPYATAVGLLRWGANQVAAGEPLQYETTPGGSGLLSRVRDGIRNLFP